MPTPLDYVQLQVKILEVTVAAMAAQNALATAQDSYPSLDFAGILEELKELRRWAVAQQLADPPKVTVSSDVSQQAKDECSTCGYSPYCLCDQQ